MLNLTHLPVFYSVTGPVANLEGLQYARNLRNLHLQYGSPVRDFTPLVGLPLLHDLTVRSAGLRDISMIPSLLELRSIDLGSNEIMEIPDLTNLPQLGVLDLHNNQIRDIEPLTHLTGLWLVYLNGNPLNEVSYSACIPQILANNPGIDLCYDPIPEPSIMTFLLLGLAGVLPWGRRYRRS